MDDDDLFLLGGAYLSLLLIRKAMMPQKRRFWVRPSLLNRNNEDLFRTLQEDDIGLHGELRSSFRNFLRMTATNFEVLLTKVAPLISRRNTKYRDAVSSQDRLAVTLRFLATGDSFRSLQYLFKISNQCISEFVPEVLDALNLILQEYIRTPRTEQEWKDVANKFQACWNYPQCCGSIDGKHCVLLAPTFSGTEFRNYKGTFSIVLLGVADADYNFIYVNVGTQGRISDGGVFTATSFKTALINNALNLPQNTALPGRQLKIPYVFLGDNAFPLMQNLMKPYSGTHDARTPQRIFNYRLSRARRIIENAFGILSSVFRVLRQPMLLEPEKAKKVVLCCTLLHNYLRKHCRKQYNPPGTFDVEDTDSGTIIPGEWRNDLPQNSFQSIQRFSGRTAILPLNIRNEFAEYFISAQGRVPWQDNF